MKCLSKYTSLSCVVVITGGLCMFVKYMSQSCMVDATRPLSCKIKV